MDRCSNCGTGLPADALFCPKCGRKTPAGVAAGVAEPWASVSEAFLTAGREMEKAFRVAGKELEEAFSKAEKEIKQSRGQTSPTICSHCGAKNPSGARFCSSCGKELTLGSK